MEIQRLNSIADTKRHLGLGHTKVYELIAQGVLDARKAGAKTLVTGESIRNYIKSLPPAPIRTRLATAALPNII